MRYNPGRVAEDPSRSGPVALPSAMHGEVMVFQPTAVREISHGGMLVETAFPLQLYSLHDFRLTLGGKSVIVKGRVANSQISDVDQDVVTYRSDVEFVEPTERVAAAIADFVEDLQSNATPKRLP